MTMVEEKLGRFNTFLPTPIWILKRRVGLDLNKIQRENSGPEIGEQERAKSWEVKGEGWHCHTISLSELP